MKQREHMQPFLCAALLCVMVLHTFAHLSRSACSYLLSTPTDDAIPAKEVSTLCRRTGSPLFQTQRACTTRSLSFGYLLDVQDCPPILFRWQCRFAFRVWSTKERRHRHFVDVCLLRAVSDLFPVAAYCLWSAKRAQSSNELVNESDADQYPKQRV